MQGRQTARVGIFIGKIMPNLTEKELVSKEKLSINIELHRNGVTVSAFVPQEDEDGPHMGEEMSYVYQSIDEMVEELPGFISVLKKEAGQSDNPTANEADMGNSKEDY